MMQTGRDQYTITRYESGDEAALWKLYFDTTHLVIGRDYTQAQCQRWAPSDTPTEQWSNRVRSCNPFVARANGEIVGFAELEENGHIDHFYVHHAWQRKGVGRALYAALVAEALRFQIPALYTESSLTAMPFFVSMGFEITEEQTTMICGSPAKRFLMRQGVVMSPTESKVVTFANHLHDDLLKDGATLEDMLAELRRIREGKANPS